MASAEIAVIGGSGFYRWLDGAEELTPSTPYGPPSGPISVGTVGGRGVAFVARHGVRHEVPPHAVNSRANLWALRDLGVRRVIGPCAVGSLRADAGPGDLLVLDQLIDRTWGRADTYLEGEVVEHVSFADPYCPELRAALVRAARGSAGAPVRAGTADSTGSPGSAGAPGQAGTGDSTGSPGSTSGVRAGFRWGGGAVHDRGTVVVVQGPRFSTRAESRWYSSAAVDVINMTQYPEAYLARELGLCYAGLALVTDRDVGVEGDPDRAPVTMEAAMAVLAANVDHTRSLLETAIPEVPVAAACACQAGGAPSLRLRR
jgi:5'-methylthioadenosine phosphorylase